MGKGKKKKAQRTVIIALWRRLGLECSPKSRNSGRSWNDGENGLKLKMFSRNYGWTDANIYGSGTLA